MSKAEDKKAERLQARQAWKEKALERIALIRPYDLSTMINLLSIALIDRRHKAQTTVLHEERFNSQSADDITVAIECVEDATRMLEISSGIKTVLSKFDGEATLTPLLKSWAESTVVDPDAQPAPVPPFEHRYLERADAKAATFIIWPAPGAARMDKDMPLAVVDVVEPVTDPGRVERARDVAQFTSNAINAYIKTTEGAEHWRKVYPVLPANTTD